MGTIIVGVRRIRYYLYGNRYRQTWLRIVESDVAPLNIGLANAYHRAQNRQAWRSLVETATSSDDDDDDESVQQLTFGVVV